MQLHRFPSIIPFFLGLPESKLHADVAQLSIELEGVDATLAPDARFLRAAERRAQVAQEPAVDPANSDLDLRGDSMSAREIGGPDRGGEAIGRGVRHRD